MNMTVRVLVTARSFGNAAGPHQDLLRESGCEVDLRARAQPMTAAELGEIIGDYDGTILGLDTCDASVLERADKLRVISRYGSGVDQVDLDAASRRGIGVTKTAGANREAGSGFTISRMCWRARDIPQNMAST